MQIKAALITLLPVVSAHFRLLYPYWRGDSLALATDNKSISQYFFPCAGIGQEVSGNNRTLWPLTGGAVLWNSSHESALTYINIATGNAVNAFSVALQPVYNETGAGVTCLHPGVEAIKGLNVTEGMNATIQVITTSSTGASLFNCADITFSKDAKDLPADQCKNSTGVGGSPIINANSINSSNTTDSGAKTGAANGKGTVSIAALLAAVGVGAAVAL